MLGEGGYNIGCFLSAIFQLWTEIIKIYMKSQKNYRKDVSL